MATSAKLLAALNLLGVAQALLLAAALLGVKRGNRIANRFLAAFTIVLAIGVGGATMASEPLISLYPHLLKVQDSIQYLGAPLLFLYVRTLIKGSSGSGKKIFYTSSRSACVFFIWPLFISKAVKPNLFPLDRNLSFGTGGVSSDLRYSLFSSLFICLSSPRCLWRTREDSSVRLRRLISLSFSRFDSCWRPSQLFGLWGPSNSDLLRSTPPMILRQ